MAVRKLTPPKVVHFFGYGMAACMKPGPPGKWEEGHLWSSDWKDVTCPNCLRGKGEVMTYALSQDGKSITCLRCKHTSYHTEDVRQRYCGFCNVFHEDLWPPARQWWLDHPDGPG